MEGLGGLIQQFAAVLVHRRHGIEGMVLILSPLLLRLVGLQFHLELRMRVEDAVDHLLQVVRVLRIDIE